MLDGENYQLFHDQIVIAAKEKKGITDISLFVVFISGQSWNEAPLAERAPFSDIKLLQRIQEYSSRTITVSTAKVFHCHLWCISKHLVGSDFFDPLSTITPRETTIRSKPQLGGTKNQPVGQLIYKVSGITKCKN